MIEYTGDAHIFPYKIGDEIKQFPFTCYPQIRGKNICVFCGMPVLKNNNNDEICHYCKKIIKGYFL